MASPRRRWSVRASYLRLVAPLGLTAAFFAAQAAWPLFGLGGSLRGLSASLSQLLAVHDVAGAANADWAVIEEALSGNRAGLAELEDNARRGAAAGDLLMLADRRGDRLRRGESADLAKVAASRRRFGCAVSAAAAALRRGDDGAARALLASGIEPELTKRLRPALDAFAADEEAELLTQELPSISARLVKLHPFVSQATVDRTVRLRVEVERLIAVKQLGRTLRRLRGEVAAAGVEERSPRALTWAERRGGAALAQWRRSALVGPDGDAAVDPRLAAVERRYGLLLAEARRGLAALPAGPEAAAARVGLNRRLAGLVDELTSSELRAATAAGEAAVAGEVRALQAASRRAAFVLTLLVLALAVVSAGSSWLLARQVIVPVERLEAAVRRAAAGDLDERVEPRGALELARLGAAFNSMAAGLASSLAVLRHAREDLERRVAARTRQLAAANDVLVEEGKRRQAAYEAMALAQAELRGILDNATEWMWQATPAGRITYTNPHIVDVLGYTPFELLAEHRAKVEIHREDRERVIAALADASRNRRDVRGIVCRCRHRDGSWRYLETNAHPLLGADGTVVRFDGATRDVTERHQLMQELASAKLAAEVASRAKSVFLATMSHEVRTPLNGMLGMTELVLDGELSAEQRGHLEIARASARSLLCVLSDVLDFAKIEAGRMALEEVPFAVHAVLGEAVGLHQAQAREKGLALTMRAAPDVPAVVEGDPTRLRQVIANLISNAVKFTAAGTVSLEVALASRDEAGTSLRFRVRDSGIGIAHNRQQSIFEPFEQADASTTRRFGGTGLGLAICRDLVERMGGSIAVASAPGAGSTFTFTARLRTVEALPPLARSQAAEGAHGAACGGAT